MEPDWHPALPITHVYGWGPLWLSLSFIHEPLVGFFHSSIGTAISDTTGDSENFGLNTQLVIFF